MEVEAGADMTAFTGYGITEPQNLFLREIFKGTSLVQSGLPLGSPADK